MTRSVRFPDDHSRIAALEKAVFDLQRALREKNTQETLIKRTLIFNYPGALTANISPAFDMEFAGRIYEVTANMALAGSTATQVALYVANQSRHTVTIGAGVTEINPERIGVAFSAGDNIQVGITTAGDGSANLVFQIRYQHNNA